MIGLWLALLGWADDTLDAHEVLTTKGERWVCWDPPSPSTELGGPIDVRVRVGERSYWSSQRCVGVDKPGVSVGVAGEEPQPARSAGPLRLHEPALESPLVPDGVQTLSVAADGSLWFARCNQGLTRLDPLSGQRRTWTSISGLPPGCVTRVSVAADGTAWAITPDRVVQVHPERGVVDIQPFDPDDQASVAAVLATSEGQVWVAGQGGRLRGLVPQDGVRRRYDGATLGALDTIEHVSAEPSGALWLSSRDRLTRLDPAQNTFEVLVSHGPRPDLPPGRPGPVISASDGAWVVMREGRPGDGSGGLVRWTEEGAVTLVLPGLPKRPLSVVRASDDALWVADADGLVRVNADRTDARRIGVRRGFVPGGPWAAPAADGAVWAAIHGGSSGVTLTLLGPDGSATPRFTPTPLPPKGTLIRQDQGVLLATADGFWSLDAQGAKWSAHPGFADALRGTTPQRLNAIHTAADGRVWIAGRDGLRTLSRTGAASIIELPNQSEVYDVYSTANETLLVATEDALLARDRLGRTLRVVDDGGRPLAGVHRLSPGPDGSLWAWGPGGAWTVQGSDAVRRLGPGVRDLVVDGVDVWAARADGVRRWVDGRFERQGLPRLLTGATQLAVRDAQLAWVRTQRGLWRREEGQWGRTLGVEGPFERSLDGTLWRWDPDGLHVLPPDAVTWRWVGLQGAKRSTDGAESAPIAADAVIVHALSGVLAVEVQGRVVGDRTRPDRIVDLDVRGTRWAALSQRGVLLRGDGYRLLERSYVPGPARRVALGPKQVCVAGTQVWCRQEGRWATVLDVLDLPAPVPAVDVAVDDEGLAWSLHPGALCRQGTGCRGVPGLAQTSLVIRDTTAFIGSTQGLYRVKLGERPERVRQGASV
ncbi:MAG: hypothetical protein AB8H79_02750, partial [Myxococcota bacterium]